MTVKLMSKVELLAKNWSSDFKDFLSAARKEIMISSPFINSRGVDFLLEVGSKDCAVTVLTNLSCNNVAKGVTDPGSVASIFNKFKGVRVSSVENLHAKVYIIDGTKAIVTSANLTNGGIYSNLEYGVLFNNVDIVQAIHNDLGQYFSLGNVFDEVFLHEISKIQKNIERVAKKESREYNAINELLLENRVKEGRTINGIFSETIVYLLEKHGALSTSDLNGRIERMHPDICDDTVDRVINGQHFGKKWKHLVRGAQQSLKRQNKIILEEGLWKLSK